MPVLTLFVVVDAFDINIPIYFNLIVLIVAYKMNCKCNCLKKKRVGRSWVQIPLESCWIFQPYLAPQILLDDKRHQL